MVERTGFENRHTPKKYQRFESSRLRQFVLSEKYSFLFSFCARWISFSPNEKSIFLKVQIGGVCWTKFECILKATLMPTNRTRGARGGSKLPRTLVSFRHCLAEPRQPRKKNTPCFLDLAGVKFLLKKERVFFFRGSALQVFGQVAEQCGRSFGKTIFWGKDLPKLRLILF